MHSQIFVITVAVEFWSIVLLLSIIEIADLEKNTRMFLQ